MNGLSFEINVTEDCNLRCSYCSELFRERHKTYISDKIVRQAVDFIKNQSEKRPEVLVNYFGGEPLLDMSTIIYMTKQLETYNNVHFGVITNGTMLAKNTHFFEEYKDRFNIQISYDGNPNHDKNRNNSSKLVKENIAAVKDLGLKLNLHGVICPKDFDKFYDAYMDMTSIDMGDNENVSRSFVVEFASSYADVAKETKIEWLRNLEINLKKIMKEELSHDKPLMDWFRLYDNGNAINAYCSAGINNYSLSFNGDIYKCHGAVYSTNPDKHLICSIFDPELEDKLKAVAEEHQCHACKSEKCRNCDTLICYNCHTSNYEWNHDGVDPEDYFGRWNSKNDSYICQIYKLITKYLRAYDVLKNAKSAKKK